MLQSALFKAYLPLSDQEANTQIMQDAEVLLVTDQDGNKIDGAGWSLAGPRIDDDYHRLWICTDEAVMAMLVQDPRLELLEQLSGWPEPELEPEEPEDAEPIPDIP